jgi:predicted O-methyltransferase YrrM
MLSKARARLRPEHRDEAAVWCHGRAESADDFANNLDPGLWAETGAWANEFEPRAREHVASLGVRLGGAGHYRLVHFLVLLLQPDVVLETGVAAGWTSQAILTALRRNGHGTLYSSDFPYFRLENPERYIGCLVDSELRLNWHLETRGDRVNLTRFLPQIDAIDILHYDSDKSIDGRQHVLDTVSAKLAADAVIVMDDVGDNTFFRDWATRSNRHIRIFEHGGRYVGLAGL